MFLSFNGPIIKGEKRFYQLTCHDLALSSAPNINAIHHTKDFPHNCALEVEKYK